jgi:hypothetical protein
MAKRNAPGDPASPPAKHWSRHVITLVLLVVVIVAGSMVYFSRQEWRAMYMSLIHRNP